MSFPFFNNGRLLFCNGGLAAECCPEQSDSSSSSSSSGGGGWVLSGYSKQYGSTWCATTITGEPDPSGATCADASPLAQAATLAAAIVVTNTGNSYDDCTPSTGYHCCQCSDSKSPSFLSVEWHCAGGVTPCGEQNADSCVVTYGLDTCPEMGETRITHSFIFTFARC